MASLVRTVGGRRQPVRAVCAQPAERLRLPRSRPMADPRQVHEVAVPANDEVGERATREVRRSDAVTYVTACPRRTGRSIETDRRVKVAWHAERSAPLMRD